MKKPATQPVLIEVSVYKKLLESDVPLKWFVSNAIKEKLVKYEGFDWKKWEKLNDDYGRSKNIPSAFVRIEKSLYQKIKTLGIKHITWFISRAVEEKLLRS